MEIKLLKTETPHKWKDIMQQYAFTEPPRICKDKGCPNAVRHSLKCVHTYDIEIDDAREALQLHTAYSKGIAICYNNWPLIKEAVDAHFKIDEFIQVRQNIGILKLKGSHPKFDIVHIWLNVVSRTILAVADFRSGNFVDHFDAELSRDGSVLASLYIHMKVSKGSHLGLGKNEGQYLLSLYNTGTGQMATSFSLPFSAEPTCMTFDPEFKDNSRLIVFSRKDQSLNAMCLNTRRIVKSVRLKEVLDEEMEETAWLRFTKDARFIVCVLQGIDFDSVRAATYVFDSVLLTQIARIPAEIDISNIPCSVEYTPAFSQCGTRFCLLRDQKGSMDDLRSFSRGFETLCIQVYQLPSHMTLASMCRTAIQRSMTSEHDVHKLPLPSRMTQFLQFTPDLYCTTSEFRL